MRRVTIISLVVLCSIIIGAVSGCGDDDSGGGDTDTDSDTDTDTDSDTDTDTDTDSDTDTDTDSDTDTDADTDTDTDSDTDTDTDSDTDTDTDSDTDTDADTDTDLDTDTDTDIDTDSDTDTSTGTGSDTGTAASIVVSFPDSPFAFGQIPYNSWLEQDFVYTNQATSTLDLTISNITLVGDTVFTITAGEYTSDIVVAPGDSHTVTVRYAPVSTGSHTAQLVVEHDAGVEPSPYTIALSGDGTAQQPVITSATVTPPYAQQGDVVTLEVIISDPNNDLPTTDDIASMNADLSEVGGSSAYPLSIDSVIDSQTASYIHDVDTTSLANGLFSLTTNCVDQASLGDASSASFMVYTGTILHVGADETYATIQAAINAASDSDLVLVHDGVYTGAGNKNLHTDGKQIVVTSENGTATTTIDCEGVGRAFNLNDTGETSATVISGFTMQNCAAGAFRIVASTTDVSPVISNCAFLNNSSADSGGAILVDISGGTSALQILDSSFVGNTAISSGDRRGGAIYATPGTTPEIRRCEFTSNDAWRGGAIDFVSLGSAVISECSFTGNGMVEAEYGGALRVGPNVQVQDSVFSGNGVSNLTHGGAIRTFLPTTISGCDFVNNQGEFGGAIYVHADSTNDTEILTLEDSTFQYNGAVQGGAIYQRYSRVYATDCMFVGNQSTGDYFLEDGGGAFYIWRGYLDCTGCDFIENQAEESGGAIYGYDGVWDQYVNLTDCSFVDQYSGSNGGAIFSDRHLITVVNALFASNESSWSGGAIHSDRTTTLTGCALTQNVASYQGGAVFVTSSLTMENCLVAQNSANNTGGGIFSSGIGSVVISSSTIADNTSGHLSGVGGGGVYLEDKSAADILDSVIWGNEDDLSDSGSADELALAGSDAYAVTIEYCLIDESAGSIYDPYMYVNDGSGFYAGDMGNLSSDPFFANGPSGGYYLSQTAAGQSSDSPCLDSGSDTAVTLGLDSLTTRTDLVVDTGQVDMGFHYVP